MNDGWLLFQRWEDNISFLEPCYHQHSAFINGLWNEKVSDERLLKGAKCIRNQIHDDIDTTVYIVMWQLYR